MVAPTPVSAYLHSATMVKAGVYLIARLNPYFRDLVEWQTILIIFGGITMLTGAIWSLFQSDLKKILAYTTISALGIMMLSVGIGTPKAVQGGMVFLFAHALYKGGLFLVAGNVDHATGTRDVTQLRGLFSKMRFTGTGAVLTSLSMAGFPFFTGFLAKELLYESALKAPWISSVLTPAIFLTGIVFAYIAFLIGYKVFLTRNESNSVEKVHELSSGMYLGPLLLGFTGLIAGSFPGIVAESLLSEAAVSVSSGASGLKLYIWHGFTFILLLSILTLLSGWGLYKFSGKFIHRRQWLTLLERIGPEAIYDSSWKKLTGFAESLTRKVQSGYLRFYIMTILITLIVLVLFPVWYYKLFDFNFSFEGVESYEVILGLLVFFSIFFTVKATSRIAAIAILGVAGYGIAIFFAIYGAPDLSMTQFLIETLTVVIFVLVLYKLPGYKKISPGLHRWRDSIIAIAGGTVFTFIILLITNYLLISELKLFFAANSYILAKGRNVVNVILVDFRALDTLGEITVLGIAAIGVFAMMKLKLSNKER
jgi:multicomponent Na+:H+ antiporter subunit A